MGQLARLFQLQLSTSCYPRDWQQSHLFSPRARLRAPVSPPRWITITRPQVPELTPKELHHLRKKEEQKRIRKINKESRRRLEAQEKARIPVVKPNPALLRFDRPLKNWNRPWKQKQKASKKRRAFAMPQTVDALHTTAFDERKPLISKRELTLESIPMEATPMMMNLWSEFEAAYVKRVDGNADLCREYEGSYDTASNEPTFSSGRGIETDYMEGSTREMTSDRKKEDDLNHEEWIHVTDRNMHAKMNSTGTREYNSALFLHPPSRNNMGKTGTLGSQEVAGEISVQGSRLSDRAVSDTNVEGIALQLSRDNEQYLPSLSVPWVEETETATVELDISQAKGDTCSWRHFEQAVDSSQHAEKEAKLRPVELATTSDARLFDQVELAEAEDIFKVRSGIDKIPHGSNMLVTSDLDKFPSFQSPVVECSDSESIETSEFWERRDMLLDERFDRESLRTKFENSAEPRKPRKGESAGPGKVLTPSVRKVLLGRRKGRDVYLSSGHSDAISTQELPRSDLDENKQLEWLAKQLDIAGRPDGVHFSRLMRSGGLKITDGRAVILVQKLGEVGNWRRAMQVVEWVNSRNHFPPLTDRYVFTALLNVLRKARRPVEALNVFNVMREDVHTYPDMIAYRITAVTLGQSGCMEELFDLMQSLRRGPEKNTKYLIKLFDNGRLRPDVVVFNAALNSCVPHKQWQRALWILDELHKEKAVWPTSASYGLAIEVMVKAGKFDLAWETLEKMELGGFYPNPWTYKVLVEALGHLGKVDLAIEMVKQMEQRGMVHLPAVYFELASTLCKSGQWRDALQQVEKVVKHSEKPLALVSTYTGLIKACKDAGLLADAISVFQYMEKVCAPNVGTYNIMISIYGKNKMYAEAKKLFDEIKTGRRGPQYLYLHDSRLAPDMFTYDAMLGSCCHCKRWGDLEVLFRQMLLQGYQLSSVRHTWIMHCISRAKKDDLVATMFNLFLSLNDVNSELFFIIIQSCLRGGDFANALSHLKYMVQKDVRISSSLELEKFQKLAIHLSEEDSAKFLNTLKGIKVTSDFKFKKTKP